MVASKARLKRAIPCFLPSCSVVPLAIKQPIVHCSGSTKSSECLSCFSRTAQSTSTCRSFTTSCIASMMFHRGCLWVSVRSCLPSLRSSIVYEVQSTDDHTLSIHCVTSVCRDRGKYSDRDKADFRSSTGTHSFSRKPCLVLTFSPAWSLIRTWSLTLLDASI